MQQITYKAPPTFKIVHKLNDKLVKAIRGPIGIGKSVGCVMELFRICLNQEADSQGIRRARIVCIRNTYPELKGTVIKTFQDWIPQQICPIVYTRTAKHGLKQNFFLSHWISPRILKN